MIRISSNSTLFLKIFIPIFWTVFFGAVILAMFSHSGFNKALNEWMKGLPYVFLAVFLAVVLALYLTVWKLKRVECDEFFFFVTNYFKTARYPYHQIENISETGFFSFTIVDIELKTKGIFGKRIFFLGRNSTLNQLYNKKEELGNQSLSS